MPCILLAVNEKSKQMHSNQESSGTLFIPTDINYSEELMESYIIDGKRENATPNPSQHNITHNTIHFDVYY